MFDQPCFQLVARLRYDPKSRIDRKHGGAFVNFWVLASSEQEARRKVIEAAPIRIRGATVVRFTHVGPGDPHELTTEDDAYGVGENARPMTDDELAKAFSELDGLIYTAEIVWLRPLWWQFWKWKIFSKPDDHSAS